MNFPLFFSRPMLKTLALIFGLLITQFASAANTPCEDVYRSMLKVHIEDEGRSRAINSTAALPIKIVGGKQEIMLEVRRIDDSWVQVDAGYIVNDIAHAWFVRIQMDRTRPVAYSKKFRPTESMPKFTLELIPVCTPA